MADRGPSGAREHQRKRPGPADVRDVRLRRDQRENLVCRCCPNDSPIDLLDTPTLSITAVQPSESNPLLKCVCACVTCRRAGLRWICAPGRPGSVLPTRHLDAPSDRPLAGTEANPSARADVRRVRGARRRAGCTESAERLPSCRLGRPTPMCPCAAGLGVAPRTACGCGGDRSKSTFDGFTSRWMMFFSCAFCKARATCAAILNASADANAP